MKKLLIITILAILYFLLAKIRFENAIMGEIVSPTIFPSEGVALAFAIYFGKWVWPGIFIGQFALALSNGISPQISLIISSINSIEAIIGYYLFKKLKIDIKLFSFRDIFLLFAIIIFILQPFSAIPSNFALYFSGYISSDELLSAIKSWWFGNVMGQILYTPAILTFFTNRIDLKEYLAIGLGFGLALFGFVEIFNIKSSLLLLTITLPIILFTIYKRNISYAFFMIITASYALFISTVNHKGPFVNNLNDYNLFMLVIIVVSLITNSIINTYKHFENKLKEEIKKALEENRHQQLIMLQQNRLAQMGEMINMIAHQWRQPLNNLSVLNHIIISKYYQNSLNDEIVKYFQSNSKTQIDIMTQTINDFRDFFRPKEKPQEFNIQEIINKTLGILRNVFEFNNITIKTSIEDSKCLGYPNSIGHILLNILNNAKDALIEREIENKEISITTKKINNKIVIEIEDNAGGIDEDKIDKIFDPYFSTKLEKNGTGLGLYMSQMIINHINGNIEVKNGEKGAIFKIEFDCS